MTLLLYAVGAGACASVVAGLVVVPLRYLGVAVEPVGSPIVLAVAASVVVAALGAGSRGALLWLALLGLAAPFADVLSGVLGVAFAGRSPFAGGSTDAFRALPRALVAIFTALVIGAALGAIARAYPPTFRRRPPERLLRSAGAAYVVGSIVALLWPVPFIALELRGSDMATALISLPVVVAGSLAGGVYAARSGVPYGQVFILGLFLALPSLLTLLVGTSAEVGRLSDPRFAAAAAQIRSRIALSWLLVAFRVGTWPLGAAFARGFLDQRAPS